MAASTLVVSTAGRRGVIVNAINGDWSGAEEIRAAPGAGKSIYLRHLVLSNGGTGQNVTIGEDASGTAVATVIVGPIYLLANTTKEISFPEMVKLTANKALAADTSGTSNLTILATLIERA